MPPIKPAEREDRLPLSFAQQRLWFLAQMGGQRGTYHIPFALLLRGHLDRHALRLALDRILARHEALRTTFALIDGGPGQLIAPAEARFRLSEHDLSSQADADEALRRLAAEEARAPFDLEPGRSSAAAWSGSPAESTRCSSPCTTSSSTAGPSASSSAS